MTHKLTENESRLLDRALSLHNDKKILLGILVLITALTVIIHIIAG